MRGYHAVIDLRIPTGTCMQLNIPGSDYKFRTPGADYRLSHKRIVTGFVSKKPPAVILRGAKVLREGSQ